MRVVLLLGLLGGLMLFQEDILVDPNSLSGCSLCKVSWEYSLICRLYRARSVL